MTASAPGSVFSILPNRRRWSRRRSLSGRCNCSSRGSCGSRVTCRSRSSLSNGRGRNACGRVSFCLSGCRCCRGRSCRSGCSDRCGRRGRRRLSCRSLGCVRCSFSNGREAHCRGSPLRLDRGRWSAGCSGRVNVTLRLLRRRAPHKSFVSQPIGYGPRANIAGRINRKHRCRTHGHQAICNLFIGFVFRHSPPSQNRCLISFFTTRGCWDALPGQMGVNVFDR